MFGFTTNINDFNVFLQDVISKSGIPHVQVVKKVGLDLLSRIILKMPVDTGRARAGWSLAGKAIGVPIPVSLEAKPGDSQYSESIGQDQIILRMINNVHYVSSLEYGSSKQAPLGMVRISMLEVAMGNQLPDELGQNYVNLWNTLATRRGRFQAQSEIFGRALPS